MSDLPSALSKVQVESTRFRSAASESVVQQMGSSINGLIDDKATQDAAIAALQGKVFSKLVTPTLAAPISSGIANLFSVTLAADEIVQAVGGHGVGGVNFVTGVGFVLTVVGSTNMQLTRNGVPIYSFGVAAGGSLNVIMPSIVLDQPGAGTWTYGIEVLSGTLSSWAGRIMVTKLKAGLP